MKFIFPVIAAFALTAPLAAQDAAGEGRGENPTEAATERTVDAAAETEADQNRVICKTEKVSGTRLGAKKVCRTAAQWEQARQEQRQAVERTQAARWKAGNE